MMEIRCCLKYQEKTLKNWPNWARIMWPSTWEGILLLQVWLLRYIICFDYSLNSFLATDLGIARQWVKSKSSDEFSEDKSLHLFDQIDDDSVKQIYI